MKYTDVGTHWITLYALNNITYFDSSGVEYILKEIKILKQIYTEYKQTIQ